MHRWGACLRGRTLQGGVLGTSAEPPCSVKPTAGPILRTLLRADFREGDEDSNFSIFRVRRFSEWREPLH